MFNRDEWASLECWCVLPHPLVFAERPRQDHVRPSDRGQMHRTYIVREGQRGGQEQEGDVVVVAVGVVQRVYLGLGHVHHHPALRQVAHSTFDRVSAFRLESSERRRWRVGGRGWWRRRCASPGSGGSAGRGTLRSEQRRPRRSGSRRSGSRRLKSQFHHCTKRKSDTFDTCQTKMSNYFDTDFVKAIDETREFSKHSDFDCALDVTKHKN
jgi:hypothetical protein